MGKIVYAPTEESEHWDETPREAVDGDEDFKVGSTILQGERVDYDPVRFFHYDDFVERAAEQCDDNGDGVWGAFDELKESEAAKAAYAAFVRQFCADHIKVGLWTIENVRDYTLTEEDFRP